MRVRSRLQSGTLEVMFKQHVADKTNWRVMLKSTSEPVDLLAEKDRLLELCESEIEELTEKFGFFAISILTGIETVSITYPIIEAPEKITSLNFDKQAEIEGVLLGIKGQYLLFDTGVINLRRFSGYNIELLN
jgi:hypothetical protein